MKPFVSALFLFLGACGSMPLAAPACAYYDVHGTCIPVQPTRQAVQPTQYGGQPFWIRIYVNGFWVWQPRYHHHR